MINHSQKGILVKKNEQKRSKKKKPNKQDYTVGTVPKFIQKIIETGNRKRLLNGFGTCILIKGGRVILVYLPQASQCLLWNKC